MPSLVLDTNVLISAIMFSGPPRKLLQLVITGKVKLCLSEPIITELEGVLQRPKFGLTGDQVALIVAQLLSTADIIRPNRNFQVIEADPKDDKILDCAVEAKADYIISGDKHLLELRLFRGIPVLNPTEYLSSSSAQQ